METLGWRPKMSGHLVSVILAIVGLLVVVGCTKQELLVNQPVKSGQVAFSFQRTNPHGGRVEAQDPAFVSYTLKKPDGSTVSKKVELFQFNSGFVTQPQQLDVGHYELQQFLLLAADNSVIAAAPLAGSELAALVEHPLPMAFDVAENETSNVVPEVVLVENHTAEAFGYVTFGFDVVSLFSFDTYVTIADNNTYDSIGYSLEIIAKDAPLGNVKWTRTILMPGNGKIYVPNKYGHYTFKAIKTGYISHIQHFLTSELSGSTALNFEFIPSALTDFLLVDQFNGAVKIYLTKDQYRTKSYARIDVAEGYSVSYMYSNKAAVTKGGSQLGPMTYSELFTYGNRVNIFGNTPFGLAQDFYSGSNLPIGQTHTMDDVNIQSFTYVEVHPQVVGLPDIGMTTKYQVWKGAHN